MIIKEPEGRILTNLTSFFRNKKVIIYIIVIISYTGFAFMSGAHVKSRGYIGNIIKPLLTRPYSYGKKIIKGLVAKTEHISIDIKQKDFMKIAYKRSAALQHGILISSVDDYVPAIIRYKDAEFKANIRLKGDLRDHWEGDKWSLRIKIAGDNTLFGMKTFSIQNPSTRNYIYEWLFHKMLSREGLLAMRYKFIDVTINGKKMGIYALEEHFDSRILSFNNRREGPIFKFNFGNQIDVFQESKILNDSLLGSQFRFGKDLLTSFLNGDKKTSTVFDVQKLARYMALCDLTAASHAVSAHNIRFYFNPVTALFEPIGFDAEIFLARGDEQFLRGEWKFLGDVSDIPWKNLPYRSEDFFQINIFNDPVFFREYVKQLEMVADPGYINKLLEDIQRELNENLDIIYSEYPMFEFRKDYLFRNQQYIRDILEQKYVQAFYKKSDNNEIVIEFLNFQSFPLEVTDLSYKDKIRFRPVQESLIPATLPGFLPKPLRITFQLAQGTEWNPETINELTFNFKVLGASKIRQTPVLPYPYLTDDNFNSDHFRKQQDIHMIKYLDIDDQSKTISFKLKNLFIDKDLVIPEGYRLICHAGTKINLTKSAKIVSNSPLEFIGDQENPIIIKSGDSTGQGILVMANQQLSHLSNVHFINLASPTVGNYSLTGAVTFYESDVKISSSIFKDSRSEDALNIIRSSFEISNTLFENSKSDAFDGDFTKGTISNSSFVNSTNDAIDVSGSQITINNIFINNAGDKAISVGEMSNMEGGEVKIINSQIGIASKDLSTVNLSGVSLADTKVGFAVFQKKSEFGPGEMHIKRLAIKDVEVPYLIEKGSTLTLEGNYIKNTGNKIKEILYGVEYGKSSR